MSTPSRSYGTVTKLAKHHNVSRGFLYSCQTYLDNLLSASLSALKNHTPIDIVSFILSSYLELKGSVYGISQSSESLFEGFGVKKSTISSVLNDYGSKLPSYDLVSKKSILMASDEIFVGNQPILVSVCPQTHYIYHLELSNKRDGEAWVGHWLLMLGDDPTLVKKLVSDLGSGLLKGAREIFDFEKQHQVDLFHYLHKISYLHRYCERIAHQQIDLEYKREKRLLSLEHSWAKITMPAKSVEKAYTKDFQEAWSEYIAAHQKAEQAIYQHEIFSWLYVELVSCFRWLNKDGTSLRYYQEVQTDLNVVLELLRMLRGEKLKKGIAFLEKHENGVLNYLRDVEKVDKELAQQINDPFIKECFVMLSVEEKQLYKAKDQTKKIAIQKWKDYLTEVLGQDSFQKYYLSSKNLFRSILRASSAVENINGQIRPYIEACKGQINQNRLNLIRFYLNHKKFQRSEQDRKGYSPWQLYTQNFEDHTPWLDKLKTQVAQENEKREVSSV